MMTAIHPLTPPPSNRYPVFYLDTTNFQKLIISNSLTIQIMIDNCTNYLDQANEELLIWTGAQKEEHHQAKAKERRNKTQCVEKLRGDHERYSR